MKHTFSLLFFFTTTVLSAQKYADCDSANYICHKATFLFDHCSGEGKKPNEADFLPCFIGGEAFGNAEKNSTWMKFQFKTAGTFLFEIEPLAELDDLDFAVFKLDKSGDCNKPRDLVRCMAAGSKSSDSPCLGKTGLREKAKDTFESAGCNNDQNSFLKPLKVKPDEWYTLLVSNFTSNTGFKITFTGDAKLECEE